MRGFEEFETAEFDERDIAARELEFERSAMVRRERAPLVP
jgi:hypothetical protein